MTISSIHASLAPRAAVSGAIFREEEILLVKRGREPARDLWSLPGGHIELGETAQDAMHRELAEETGIVARLFGVADAVDVVMRDRAGAVTFHRVIVVFGGVWLDGVLRAGSDVAEAVWLHPSSIAGLAATAGLAASIEKARRLLLHASC